jgi:hypothetical protein
LGATLVHYTKRPLDGSELATANGAGQTEFTGSIGMWRALHAAALVGESRFVGLLLDKVGDLATHIDPIAGMDGGWTLLHRAAYNGHEEVVRLLLKKGANIAAKSSKGATALDATKKHPSVVQLLITEGANSTEPTDWTLSPAITFTPKSLGKESFES